MSGDFDLSQYSVNRTYLNSLIEQINEISKASSGFAHDSDLIVRRPLMDGKKVEKAGEIVLPLLPSELGANAREILMRSLADKMNQDVATRIQKISKEQYGLMFDQIQPRLVLIQRIQNMIDQANMSKYGQVDNAVVSKLRQIMYDVEDPIKQYLNNRDSLVQQVQLLLK